MSISPLAGTPAPTSALIDVPKLVTAYYAEKPDPASVAERVAFGTSGHRGSAFARTFNQAHILAIAQAICLYRRTHLITGPLFLGKDTHALSQPAFVSALEVLAANGVDVMVDADDDYTPTPVISHAILGYNRGRVSGLADGIVITPSHNPPEDGGFKYNPPHGGPADNSVTGWIEQAANGLLADDLRDVVRIAYARARTASTTHPHDYIGPYVDDLGHVLDMDAIRGAGVRVGVDPLGGASVHYWHRIAARYGVAVEVVNDTVDPTFRFMTLDWDGRIRMDCSSPYAMAPLVGLRDRFDGCDSVDHFGPHHDVGLHGVVLSLAAAGPGVVGLAGVRGGAPLHVDHADLPRLTSRIVGQQLREHIRRLDAFGEEIEAARAVFDDGRCLRADGAYAGAHVRHGATDEGHARRHRRAGLPGRRIDRAQRKRRVLRQTFVVERNAISRPRLLPRCRRSPGQAETHAED